MGTSSRVFLLSSDDSIERLPRARFDRLWNRHRSERLLEYADRRVRCAVAFLKLDGKKPADILHIDYFWLTFDEEGALPNTQFESQGRLVGDMIEPVSGSEAATVLRARSRFAKKRYLHEFTWVPTPEVEDALVRACLGSERR